MASGCYREELRAVGFLSADDILGLFDKQAGDLGDGVCLNGGWVHVFTLSGGDRTRESAKSGRALLFHSHNRVSPRFPQVSHP